MNFCFEMPLYRRPGKGRCILGLQNGARTEELPLYRKGGQGLPTHDFWHCFFPAVVFSMFTMNATTAPPTPPEEPADASPPPARRDMLVVDDHDLVRLGLRALLQSLEAPGQAVGQVHEARTLHEALNLYAVHRDQIALVLLDLHLPDSHGTSGLKLLRERYPQAQVVVLSAQTSPSLMHEVLELGAVAFLPKSGDLHEVVAHLSTQGLITQAQNADPIQPEQPAAQSHQADSPGADDADLAALEPLRILVEAALQGRRKLTPRQMQVLERVLIGESNKLIARHTGLNEGTVKNHVSAILLIFGARSRSQLISLLR